MIAESHPRLRDLAICLVLCGVTALAYLPMLTAPHEFLLFDDVGYVIGNPQVRSGINRESLRWALTAVVTDNWHPLTMLSHMLDVELFGVDPRWHHAVNLLLHVANSAILYLVLRAMTGAVWRSALVAALFAWHPLRVESVAWLAERKDVLCALFWFLALSAYTAYARRGGRWRYALVALMFAFALLSKPMAVTLPFLLLLLDYWPLARVPARWWSAADGRRVVARLVLEKLPLVVLTVVFIGTTLATQSSRHLESRPDLATRVAQAAVSYGEYVAKAVWPAPLYMPYLYSEREVTAGAGAALVASVLLLGVSIAVLAARRRPYLAVGWFWFLGTLVPVIGLVQVGAQSIADRYTYVPMVGLYLIVAWLVGELAERSQTARYAVCTAAALTLAALVGLTVRQVPVWHDTSSLFAHTIRHSPRNHIAQGAYGSARMTAGDYATAIEHLEIAVSIEPDMFEPTINLARLHRHLGHAAESIGWFRRASEIQPENVNVQAELARMLASSPDPATRDAVEAERLARRASAAYEGQNPAMLDILAMAYAAQGRFDDALATARFALRIAQAREAAGDAESRLLVLEIERRIALYEQNEPYVLPLAEQLP